MQESIQIAYTYARDFCNVFYKNNFLEINDVHIHFPEGASKKDGPSAGIAISSSLISLALNQPIPQDTAMTGEITLQGKVLKIGGVKEKLLAAKREGIKTVIFPKENQPDVDELKDYIKQDMKILFANSFWDVVRHIFPEVFMQIEDKIKE
jgi:Lon-like ATP-dependent protease